MHFQRFSKMDFYLTADVWTKTVPSVPNKISKEDFLKQLEGKISMLKKDPSFIKSTTALEEMRSRQRELISFFKMYGRKIHCLTLVSIKYLIKLLGKNFSTLAERLSKLDCIRQRIAATRPTTTC